MEVMGKTPPPPNAYQGEDDRELQYNDYAGYFEDMLSDESLKIKKNVRLYKSLKKMVDEFYVISSEQNMQNLRKEDLIIEMANTMEQIYLNTGQPHLVETIATSLCLIINKKDKVTSPTWIYRVLESKYKKRYISEFSRTKRHDIFSKRNVDFTDMREGIATLIKYYEELPKLEPEKQMELINLLNIFDDLRVKVESYLRGSRGEEPGLPSPSLRLPEEDNIASNDRASSAGSQQNQNQAGNQTGSWQSAGNKETDSNSQYYPVPQESLYYYRLGQYIEILNKVRDNVRRFPPSPELDDLLDKSLALEIDMLMPSIDMKFKRSIPQLDETIQYANDQSLNGASSVMSEKAIVRDDVRGNLIDPNNIYAKFLEMNHKLTPEQIDTRRPYVSNIRRKMAKYNPHLYYHIHWYEGSEKYHHKLAMGKFARSNLYRKKIVNN